MKRELIREIGFKKKVKDLNLFVEFLSTRFPDEDDDIKSYFSEWADRFNTGVPKHYMDSLSLNMYNGLVKRG